MNLALEDGRWEVVEHRDAVAVLALRDGKVLAVKQYRVAIGRETIELPAGLIEPGENPEDAARRELMEEAGFDAQLEPLVGFYTSPGFCDEYIHLFKATHLTPRKRPPDPGEAIEVLWLEPRVFLEGIQRGEIATSGPTVAGLLTLGRI